ncbi:MAG: hypothetical protein IJV19_04345 [Prevotella sp.]|nr:hypothetical protein [Prevotella sp.]
MAQYAIYTIKFKKSNEQHLDNQDLDADVAFSEARERFAKILQSHELKIFRTKNDGTADVYPNYIWYWTPYVYVIRLNNRLLMKLVQLQANAQGGAPKCVESKIESNPYCYVIVDLRPDRCQLAIEKSSAWKSDPDFVRNVLQETFTFRMKEQKLEVELDAKMQPTRIWEYCRHRVIDLQDPIVRVSLELENPDKIKQYIAPNSMGQKVQAMVDVVRNSKAVRALFTLYADQNDPMEIDEKVEDIAEIVGVCSSNAYHLTIHFKKMKAYRCDEKVKAMFPVPKGVIESFQQGNKVLAENNEEGEFALVQWLDYVYEETKNFEDAAQIHRPRKNRRKK